jgi:hypothetical protein
MRKLTLTIVPLLLLGCGQEPAAPAPPELSAARRTAIERGLTDHVAGAYLGSCSGFDILSDWDAEIQFNLHFDKDGNLVRQETLYHLIGLSAYYNSVDPNLVLYGGPNETQNIHWDYVDGWLLSAGPVWRLVVPGYGPILMETGVWKVDLATWTITHSAGQNQVLDGDFASLCDALTP